MTTIAASKTEMAADSLVSVDSTAFHTPKIFVIGGHIIGLAGHSSSTNKFLDWFREGQPANIPELDAENEFVALVLSGTGLAYYTGCYSPDEIHDPFFAIGSGAHAALAALHLGKTPTEAVELACKIDLNSGGPIQTVKTEVLGTKYKPRRTKN